ncbi:MAG: mechanosensitive ion channel family protein [Rhodocyclaceae bacterium]|nr:mechanosensitive ion channel family protein [Rhodocyclaceae bacterium]
MSDTNQALVLPSRRWHLLGLPLLLLSTALVLLAVLRSGNAGQPISMGSMAVKSAATFTWIALAFLAIRVIDLTVWYRKRSGADESIPVLLRQLVALVVWVVALCAVIALVFGQSITAILTASTVALGVLGFALQRPIMDAFSGVVIALQRPFKEGDWVQTDDHGSIGRIVEMNWRAVRLVSTDEISFILPNSQLTNLPVKIYSRPEPYFRDEISITLPFHVTTHQGQRLLLGAANQVEEIASIPRESIVTITDYTESGVLWCLHYWCPNPGRQIQTRFKVNQNILRNLHYAGVQIPVPMRVLQHLDQNLNLPAERDIDQLIARTTLFAGLKTDELRYLSQHCHSRIFNGGVAILRQGESGSSLFILREGLLAVNIKQADGQETEVARIKPGHFFGERSLLMGEPRTASIVSVVDSSVTEISKEILAKLLRDRPEIASYMSEVLSEREMANSNKLDLQHHTDTGYKTPHSNKLFQRISTFFNLKD